MLGSPHSTVQTPPPVQGTLSQISSDPYSIGPGQHATEVEPHALANGSTIVAAFRTGRIVNGGGTDIGWATSTDGGTTWSQGFLPGLTKGEGTGPYDAASDPAVAYDSEPRRLDDRLVADLDVSNTSGRGHVRTDAASPGRARSA